MPGERRGKLYEVVVGRALEYAFPDHEIGSQIKLTDSLIESDWVVSKNGRPKILALVTHSGTETKFTQKFYRDVAEVIQALAATDGQVLVYSFIFDGQILASLARAEAQIVNALFSVGEGDSGAQLIIMPDSKIERYAIPKDASWDKCKALLDYSVMEACDLAAIELSRKIKRTAEGGNRPSPIGDVLRKISKVAVGRRPNYSFYRGCSSLMLVEPNIRSDLLLAARRGRIHKKLVPWYFSELVGSRTLAGQVPSNDLHGLASDFDEDFLLTALERAESRKSSRYRQMLDLGYFVPKFIQWLRGDARRVKAAKIHELLLQCHRDPNGLFDRVIGGDAIAYEIEVNWCWSMLISACRESTGKKQSFGAKAIARATGNARYTLQNSIISDFENREWMMPDNDLFLVAEEFEKILAPSLVRIDSDKLRMRYAHETYVDKLGPHGVHPIPALVLERSRRNGGCAAYKWMKTSFGAAVEAKGIAGSVRVICENDDIFWWRSAHDGHEADKSKEVGARVLGLTTYWDAKNENIYRRPKCGSFNFIVDGDFSDEQILFFRKCGVDKVIVPRDI